MRSRWLLPLLLALACSGPQAPGDGLETTVPPFVESGDLQQIKERGKLRILLPRRIKARHFPRQGHSLDFERELAAQYARELGLEPVWIVVESRGRLLDELMSGNGDIVASNMTVTQERKQRVSFTVPVDIVREQLVARADDDPIREFADLSGRNIAVRRSSSFWDTVEALRDEHPGIDITEVDDSVDTEEIIHRVSQGTYDLTVADSNLIREVLDYRQDIVAALDLTGDRSIGWAVRPDSVELLQSLNHFLVKAKLTDRDDEIHTDDLAGIKKRKTLRMLTRNNAATYFLWRGELVGFEYELVREFARQHGLRLEVYVPSSGLELLAWLREGRGDLVAAALTPTEERQRDGVVFSRPYNFVSQLIVARADDDKLETPEDLAGRRIVVRQQTSYWGTLEKLREQGIALEIVAAPDKMETEEIIARVAEGEYDLTLADSHIAGIELADRDDIRAAMALEEDLALAWAVRESNPELLEAINAFVRNEYRGLFYNVIYNRYFEDSRKIRVLLEQREHARTMLSPYDDTVRSYAERYGFDWRLIVALMYEESRFDPEARSFAGAEGLMQLLPQTAEELGLEDLDDPETAIHAGIKYLAWLRDRFEEDLPVTDRMWFTLAAYNAGAGHVRDARRLAAGRGLNPNRWFDHVEQAMPLLSRKQYYGSSQHGYCRCWEPVRYVRDVRARYNAYVENTASDRASAGSSPTALSGP